METYNFPPFPAKGERRLFMPSKYTSNYQLNQWEPDDRVLRTDFNADNAKIDAALAGKLGRMTNIFTAKSDGGTRNGGGHSTRTLLMQDYDYSAFIYEFPEEYVDPSITLNVAFYNKLSYPMTFPMQSFALFFFPHHDLSNQFRCLLFCSSPKYLAFEESYQELTDFRVFSTGERYYRNPTMRFLGWT